MCPLEHVMTSSPYTQKNEILALLRGLTATHRIPGAPKIPITALAEFLGIHRRTLYKLMHGAQCSEALLVRLYHVLGRIYRGELVFEQVRGRWQGRYLEEGEVPRRPRLEVHRARIEFTGNGPRLRLLQFW